VHVMGLASGVCVHGMELSGGRAVS